jgi:hypothetical protein
MGHPGGVMEFDQARADGDAVEAGLGFFDVCQADDMHAFQYTDSKFTYFVVLAAAAGLRPADSRGRLSPHEPSNMGVEVGG